MKRRTKFEVVAGKRVSKLEREWLAHFASGGQERPQGMGPVGISNFVSRVWLIRLEREQPFGAELYRLTAEGLRAHESARKG